MSFDLIEGRLLLYLKKVSLPFFSSEKIGNPRNSLQKTCFGRIYWSAPPREHESSLVSATTDDA